MKGFLVGLVMGVLIPIAVINRKKIIDMVKKIVSKIKELISKIKK